MSKEVLLTMPRDSGVDNVVAAPFSNRKYMPNGLLVSAEVSLDDVAADIGTDDISYKILVIKNNFPLSLGLRFQGYPLSRYAGGSALFSIYATAIANPSHTQLVAQLGKINNNADSDIWHLLTATLDSEGGWNVNAQHGVYAAFAILFSNPTVGHKFAISGK